MRIYRLTLPKYAGTAFSGEGALRVGGRWTPPGFPAVHASDSIALAVLETLVHAPAPVVPSHRVIGVDVPDTITVARVDTAELPADWRRTPAPAGLRTIGRDWIEAGQSVLLRVPSAVVPLEYNFVINPRHPDFSRLKVGAPDPFEIDLRLFR